MLTILELLATTATVGYEMVPMDAIMVAYQDFLAFGVASVTAAAMAAGVAVRPFNLLLNMPNGLKPMTIINYWQTHQVMTAGLSTLLHMCLSLKLLQNSMQSKLSSNGCLSMAPLMQMP